MPKAKKNGVAQALLSPAENKALARLRLRAIGGDTIDLYIPQLPDRGIVKGDASDANGGKGSYTGVYAYSERSFALYAASPVYAGWFEGDVQVTGDLTQESGVANFANVNVAGDISFNNADCAEDFDIDEQWLSEPGTVMVVGDSGVLQPGHIAYDKRVAGVISGAGEFKPGMVFDRKQSQRSRRPIALLGKVYCKVDAEYAGIEVGDLLTTSCTLGHAMKVVEPLKAFGAVIGKALRPLKEGQGLIPMLIALQ